MARYKVQEDDTLEGIAKLHGVSESELRQWNDMGDTTNMADYVGKELNTSLKDWADEVKTNATNKIVGTPYMSDNMQSIYAQIKKRKDFKYDLDADALYQQYKNRFIDQGRLAMEDTMGQAAAMTGGYGNSYAQSVGQQAYNAQLDKLNDVIPDLYELAYNRYAKEGEDLYNKYSLAADEHDRMIQAEKDKISAAELVSPTGTTGTETDGTDEDGVDYSFNDISSLVDYKSKSGADNSEISDFLRDAYNAGYITSFEWEYLRNKYLNTGRTEGSVAGGGGSGRYTQ